MDTGRLILTGTIVDESDVDLTDISLKPTSRIIDEHPDAQILVQFKSDIDSYVGKYQVDQIENIHDLKTTETLSEQNIAVMEIDTSSIAIDNTFTATADFVSDTGAMDPITEQQITDKITELKTDPRVEHVQRNFVYQTQATTGSGFAKLWALDNQGQAVDGIIGTLDADIDYPEAITYAGNHIGSGVIVAILDTGIAYNHPDLARRMWNGANCLSDTGATLGGCIHGYDFADNDFDPMDDNGHGSHVAGTIGAISSTDGVTGVAPDVEIMAVKILGKYGSSTADVIRGINFATKNGAKVINASFGITQITQSKSDFDYMTYQAIQNFPGLFVAAAGNNGMNTDSSIKSFPAGYGSETVVSGEVIIDREQLILSGSETIPALQNVISVGATDQDDDIASFSNYGTSSVQIAAPGVNIYSTIPTGSAIGVPQPISYANGWNKKVGANPNTWTTRANAVVSGENMDISSVLWTDIRTPYVSGESSYIEKTIDNQNKDVAKVLITTWCDTPSTGDRIDILIANNGGLYNRVDFTNERYNYYEPTGRWLNIDGHTGAIAQYSVIASPDLYNATGSFDLRLKWVTTSSGVLDGTRSNALSSY